jgi:hypothetical protein
VLEPSRLGVERGQVATQLGGRLAQLQLCLAQDITRRPQLGGELLDRLKRALGGRDEV